MRHKPYPKISKNAFWLVAFLRSVSFFATCYSKMLPYLCIICRDLNRRRDVFSLLNDYYVAIYYHLYHIWKSQGKTIADTGFVIKGNKNFLR